MRISDWSSDVCSSDLIEAAFMRGGDAALDGHAAVALRHAAEAVVGHQTDAASDGDGACGLFLSESRSAGKQRKRGTGRSEEHKSELQSLNRTSYAVFCLKKKTTLFHTSAFTNI